MKRLIILLILLLLPSLLLAQETTGRTDFYYDSGNDVMVLVQSSTSDYSTAYYYDIGAGGVAYKDGVFTGIGSCIDAGSSGGSGYGYISRWCELVADPGAEYFAETMHWLVTYYYTYELIDPCGSYCDYFGDPYGYNFISINNEDTLDAGGTYEYRVWISPVLLAVLTSETLFFQNTSAASRAPGTPSSFAVRWHAFIPPLYVPDGDYCTNGTYPYVHTTIAAGDKRDFGRFGSTRANITVNLAPNTGSYSYPGYAYVNVGLSKQYEPTTAITTVGGKEILLDDDYWSDCYKLLQTDYANTSNIYVTPSGDAGAHWSKVWMRGTAVYPLVHNPDPPGVSWDITVYVEKYSSTEYKWSMVDGSWHDCWPAHEIYVGSEAIYQYPSPGNGGVSSLDNSFFSIAYCMAGGGQINIGTLGPSTAH